ncbi:uncharacterized protein LOC106768719 isoform X5 [Vigna radiata var. radiata]|uniref:Uncharacterized protein LOC106768719 isoform X5 n=1 Tax=Vigna radiata var. radiata TaxID=3916 RepID=A0A3Q0F8W8_VIGRR|nr:uncharacterized protein LOC106768719 isoform X5 [Vigna radiata var. radiata]
MKRRNEREKLINTSSVSLERKHIGMSQHRSPSPPHHHTSSRSAKPRDEMINSSEAEEMDSMDTKFETIEARITSMLPQLQSECGILQRIVYKNKNQHRRSSYFQRLLKVRRDLKLLQSANLEELVTSCLHVIKGDKPRQKVILLESLKRRKCDGEKHNFMERLLGAARLLAEILLDVVSLFNMVSSLSITKQSTKITLNGIEVFRDFYPLSDDFITLDCVWESDKFILHERIHKRKNESQAEDSNEHAFVQTSNVNYNSIDSFLGVNCVVDDQLEGLEAVAAKEDLRHVDNMNTDLSIDSSQFDTKMTVYREEGENEDTTKTSINESSQQAVLHTSSRSSTNDKLHSMPKKVAFVSVKDLTLTRPTS